MPRNLSGLDRAGRSVAMWGWSQIDQRTTCSADPSLEVPVRDLIRIAIRIPIRMYLPRAVARAEHPSAAASQQLDVEVDLSSATGGARERTVWRARGQREASTRAHCAQRPAITGSLYVLRQLLIGKTG